jgi:hypothetical protein
MVLGVSTSICHHLIFLVIYYNALSPTGSNTSDIKLGIIDMNLITVVGKAKNFISIQNKLVLFSVNSSYACFCNSLL